jgi:hypothetical protein
VRIEEPCRSYARYVARNLRKIDQAELWASEGREPFAACMDAFRHSDECITIVGDDEQVVGLAGVNGHYIWMLGTDALTATESHRRQLARGARQWIDALVQERLEMEGRVLLHNWVHAKNIDSIRWLESLGFTVHQPEPHGPSCQLFCYFCLRK